MITRKDVARRAGVSTAVVSYVINSGPRPVAPATRARVLDAIAELGYRPNEVARSLRSNRTRALALILPDSANSFFAQLAREVETAAFSSGYNLLIGNTLDEVEREQEYVRVFVERRVDGLLIVPSGERKATAQLIAASGVPAVAIDRELSDRLPSVTVDNRGGAHAATSHLIEHGHSRIACLSGPPWLTNAAQRHNGWADALHEAGLVENGLAHATSFSRVAAYETARKLFARRLRPTAVFASADEQALGVYRAAAASGLRIPDDVALASFDSAETAPYLIPSLTAVRQPIEAMAARAVDLVLARLADPTMPVTNEVLPATLAVRGSCGCDDHEPTHPVPIGSPSHDRGAR